MRQITLYQLNETDVSGELRRLIIEEQIEPVRLMCTPVWSGKSKSKVSDQDLIYHLKHAGQPKALDHPIDSGDIVLIDDRAYLLLPSKYKRLWEFLPSGVAATLV